MRVNLFTWLSANLAPNVGRTPDYLLVKDGGPVVVDVKSSKELADEDVIRLLELTREVVQSRGWDYEIACEPEKVFFANVRFLAGYR